MHFSNIFLSLLRILALLSAASAISTQYILCSDDQEYFIKAAVAEARSLARAADLALEQPYVVHSESYGQWFGFANDRRGLDIMKDSYKSLQILSGRMTRIFPPVSPTEIVSGSILYASVNASAGLCVHKEALAFTNSEALPAPYSKFSSVLFLCPSFFELPITTRLLDQYGAGKVILHEARYMSYVAGLPQKATLEADALVTMQPSNTSTNCHSAFCCSNLDSSQKHSNIENSIKFALEAKYNPELTQGNPCFTFEPAHVFRIQPRALEHAEYASSLVTSIYHQALSLQPRSVYDCLYLSVSESVSLSVSYSYSSSVSHSISLSVSYSLSYLEESFTTLTSTIPYTYTGTEVDYTYSGTTVEYTYIGTTVPYTITSTSTLQMKRRTDEPVPSLPSAISSPSSSATDFSTAGYDLEPGDNNNNGKSYIVPKVAEPISSQRTFTNIAPTTAFSTKTCIATTTFPARSFLPAQESKEHSLVGDSQLSQLLQHINLA